MYWLRTLFHHDGTGCLLDKELQIPQGEAGIYLTASSDRGPLLRGETITDCRLSVNGLGWVRSW